VDFEVMYNRVHESATWYVVEGGGSGVGGEGIDAKEHSQHGKVHHNYVYNLSRLGLYVDAWNSHDLEDIEVYQNVVHECLNGMAVGAEDGGTVAGINIHDNLFFDNGGAGVVLFSWGRNGVKKDVRICNNTIVNNRGTGIALGSETSEDIEVCNNIVFRNRQKAYDAGSASNITEKGNLFDVDPKFVDIRRGDFRLQADSPAIDAAAEAAGPALDLCDKPRISDNAMDVGCFEYQK
jgi:hypothetical protein